MKVLWTDSAIAHLQAIHDYLAQTSLQYALRIIDQITNRSIQIASFPFSGRMVPEFEVHEVREIIESSFRIIYLIKNNEQQVEILAVIHTSRHLLKQLK